MARDNVTLQDLTDWATRVGVKVVVAPSSHRGQLGKMGTVVGVTRHHTGTPNTTRPTEDYPDYEVVKEGRVGLVNSLSAYGLGRHEAIYVFSEYLSWHAGTWLWDGITDGNGHFLGIEAAGIGDWTDWQRDVYPRLVASILLGIGEGVDMMPRHADGATPAGRKTDMANEWATFHAEVANYLAHPEQIPVTYTASTSEEDELMAAKDDIINALCADNSPIVARLIQLVNRGGQWQMITDGTRTAVFSGDKFVELPAEKDSDLPYIARRVNFAVAQGVNSREYDGTRELCALLASAK